jgi:aminopeptidase N
MMPRFAAMRCLLLYGLVVAQLVPMPAVHGQDRTGPFTHPTRSIRSRSIDQQHVALDLRFDFARQEIAAEATHTLRLFTPARSIDLDAAGMQIEEVRLLAAGGEPSGEAGPIDTNAALKFRHAGERLSIDLPREFPADTQLTLTIDYKITKPRHGAHFVEPDADEPSQPRMVWTQSEPEYARYWFPCFDHPSDRLTSEIRATAPSEYVTLSNGTLESKVANSDGTTTWHWNQAKSHVPYLMSVVAGDFEVLEHQADGIPIQSYVPRGRLADAPRSFDKTPAMLKYFNRQIGVAYPWPKYAQICVDEYGWGGMEHTSATTLNLGTLHDERAHLDVNSDNLVAHELVHQWWGDLLTCKDWGEIWLNESFATYFATLWAEEDQGWDEAAWERAGDADSYLAEDARYRRSIVNYRYNTPSHVFDRHAYPKGGRVLHMLRFELGEEAFWRAIRRYAEVNQHRTVETADLRRAIEDSTGQGMNWFFDQWVYRGGHPELNVSWDYDSAAKQVKVTVKQTQKVDAVTPLFRMSAEIEIVPAGSEPDVRRVTLSNAEETFHFDAAERPARVTFDPRDWLLKKLTFDKPRDELLDQLANDKQVMPRVQAVRGLEALKDDPAVVAALAAALAGDSFWGVRQEAAKVLAKCNTDPAREALVRAAKNDSKAQVRRAALTSLASHKHSDSIATVRHAVDHDASYYAAAEGLKSLVKLDRNGSREVLLAALARDSHQDVVLKAACDGLVELKEMAAAKQLTALLNEPLSPSRRATVIGCLARLKPEDSASLERLHAQLDNDRMNIRRAAIEALAAAGDSSSLEPLEKRRSQEEMPRMVEAIDESLGKIRARLAEGKKLGEQIDGLRQENNELRSRLEKLEKASGGAP